MDRLIALLAALVGLIALGGALLVHNSATATMQRQATEIAALKDALKTTGPAPVAAPAPASSEPDSRTAETIAAVSEGSAIVEGTGPVAAGGVANLPVQGCTVMVFTADSAGFAEMRVSCV